MRDYRFRTFQFGPPGGYAVLTARPDSGSGPADIWIAHMDSIHKPRRLLAEPYDEFSPRISPDSKFIAYASDRTGNYEVYVRSIMGNDEIQVSVNGAQEPAWNSDGGEVFYRARGRLMLSAQVADRPRLAVTSRDTLFVDELLRSGLPTRPSYDVFPGGREFLMMRPVGANDSTTSEIVVLQKWHLKAKRMAPGEGG
jgi:hypothetical protein